MVAIVRKKMKIKITRVHVVQKDRENLTFWGLCVRENSVPSSCLIMGLLTILKKIRNKEREMRILMLYVPWKDYELQHEITVKSGLDNAGKTTILKRINGEPIDTISPTLGFNIKTFEHDGLVRK